MGGFGVDLEALAKAEQGIAETLAALREETWHGAEASGGAVEDWKLDPEDAGHTVISEALDAFCERGHYWVRGLIAGAQGIVQELAATRADYQGVEDQVANAFKSALEVLGGNPMGQQEPPQ